MTDNSPPRIGVLWRGDPREELRPTADLRLYRVFEELQALGVTAEPVVFAEEAVEHVREQLISLDGVVVWVNPVQDGRDRSVLDALLREAAGAGVWVSAHPDVIEKMGTKEMLARTREMEWGTDSHIYRTTEELVRELPGRLRTGVRVLKRGRGSSGDGVWKVRLLRDSGVADDLELEVLHALGGSRLERTSLGEFVERFSDEFHGGGCVVDQPYQDTLGEGMIRCYMTHDRVVGFGHQYVTALLDPPQGSVEVPAPPPRLYYGPDTADFQGLKQKLESGWIADLQERVDIDRYSLPVIWDADFLLGPPTASGEDTYVLCEINVSSVFPIPDEAFAPLAAAAVARVLAAGQPGGSADRGTF